MSRSLVIMVGMGKIEIKHGRVGNWTQPVKHSETRVERPAIEQTVQRPNVTNANGVRPKVLHIRQPWLLAKSVGGYHRTDFAGNKTATAGRKAKGASPSEAREE